MIPFAGSAQPGRETAAELNAAAVKAHEAKDYSQFLQLEKRALAISPNSPRIVYNVACGEALQGNAAEAVKRLDELVKRKLDLGAATDPDFNAIHGSPQWAGFLRDLERMRAPLVRSDSAFILEDPTLVATGLAVDPATGDTFVASVRHRKIVRRTSQGAVTDFIHEAQDGFLGGDSLAIDARRRILYASSSAIPYMLDFRPEDADRSGVFAFDLKTSRLLRKAFLPVDGKRHILNQLALDDRGTLYVSDTGTPGIYKLTPGAASLETVVAPGGFRSTQGIAFSGSDRTLFVADWTDGVWALDLATKQRRKLEAPPDSWLVGLDGLTAVPGGFIAVQIGVQPERVIRLKLDGKKQRIAAVDVLEMNHPSYAGPIQGAIFKKSFFYVANSQLSLGNPQTGAFAPERARPTIVLRLPLDRPLFK